jgi:hypothetical protein
VVEYLRVFHHVGFFVLGGAGTAATRDEPNGPVQFDHGLADRLRPSGDGSERPERAGTFDREHAMKRKVMIAAAVALVALLAGIVLL